jgi:hypothetical protein
LKKEDREEQEGLKRALDDEDERVKKAVKSTSGWIDTNKVTVGKSEEEKKKG